MNESPEPTLGNTRLAAERARLANHAAYNAPGSDMDNLYDRTGAVHELLSCTEQLVRVLGEQVQRIAKAEGLRSTDDTTPAARQALRAARLLMAGSLHVRRACDEVNEAWSALSPLYIDAPDEGGAS